MKVFVVILILLQISFIVPNPNNRIESEQKESKGISRNLSHQRRLGLFDVLKRYANGIKNALFPIANVSSEPQTGNLLLKGNDVLGGTVLNNTALNNIAEKTKTSFNNVCQKVISVVETLNKLLKDVVPKQLKRFIKI